MSVDGQVLGVATIGGTGTGAAATLVNTGNPFIVGLVVGTVIIIIAGLMTRATSK